MQITLSVCATILTALTTPVSAWQWNAGDSGPCAPPYACGSSPPPAQAIARAAGLSPNLTNSVVSEVVHQYSNASGLEKYVYSLTWRVNISAIAVPNDWSSSMTKSSSANYSEGLEIASTEWDLSWPGAYSTLNDYLGVTNLTAETLTIVQAYLPVSLLSTFENVNGDCSSALGSCTSALTSPSGQAPSVDFSDVPGCVLANVTQINSTSQVLSGNYNYSINISESFFYEQSATYPSTNQTLFNETAGILQLMVLSVTEKSNIIGQSIQNPMAPLCQIVKPYNATAATTKSSDASLSPLQTSAYAVTLMAVLAILLQ